MGRGANDVYKPCIGQDLELAEKLGPKTLANTKMLHMFCVVFVNAQNEKIPVSISEGKG